MFEPSVRHLGYERDVGVHPHSAEVEAGGHPHRETVVVGPNARGETVLNAVCPAYSILYGVKSLNGYDWPEDLVLDHLVVLAQSGDHGRLVEEPLRADPRATRHHVGMARYPRQEPLHAGELVSIVQRPERGVRDGEVADLRALGGVGQGG